MSLEDDHHHCKVCGSVCEPSESVCSKECSEKREQLVASRRRLQLVMYGAAAVLVLFLSLELFRA